MHCVKVQIEGYKRLHHAACNTDGRILAFVGMNEAGKSSMLEALAWLTNGQGDALPVAFQSRGQSIADDAEIVRATYELDDEDRAQLADLNSPIQSESFVYVKRRDGSTGADVLPYPTRDPAPFAAASALLKEACAENGPDLDALVNPDDENSETLSAALDSVVQTLGNPEDPWSPETHIKVAALIEGLGGGWTISEDGKVLALRAAESLQEVAALARSEHPRDVARRLIKVRLPTFVLFREQDRVLTTVHQIDDEAARASPQPAVANLLRIAKLDLEQLWGFMLVNDESNRETFIEEANQQLQDFFTQAWNQSNISVRLKAGDSRLEIYLKELGRGGPVTNIEERSDGLRTFVALSAFLAAQELSVPPIVLIDEAETHLHYDAQADLVGVLLKQIDVTQVFYTTHSPGCLPTDLGTGIRLLRQDVNRANSSVIESNFWTNEAPGFAPLLYAMGASAAAFSACRRAVLAEGAADMVLLPTLIRLATGEDDLNYQIAPGLANAHAFGMRTEEVASKVVYLVDGDGQGDRYRQQLVDADVDSERIFNLPKSWASEDLVDRQIFVEVINSLFSSKKSVKESELAKGQPIVKSLQDWGRENLISLPGHVAIAYALVNAGKKLALAPGAREFLAQFHLDVTKAFDR